MQLIEHSGEIFDLVQMDFTGPLTKSTSGNRCVIFLTLIDSISKYMSIKVVPNDSAKTAAEVLGDISLKFGLPDQLQTDRGSHFISVIFKRVAKRLGCVHTVSTPHHPQSQGVIERFNASLAFRELYKG